MSMFLLMSLWVLSLNMSGGVTHIQEIEYVKTFLSSLTLWLALLNFTVAPFSKFTKVYQLFLISSMVILWITFQTSNLLSYYFFFEVSILPILFLVAGWGYQPERISSFFFMFFYTLFGSLPLLMVLIYLLTNVGTLNSGMFISYLSAFSSLEVWMMYSAFFIKLPLYFTHMWLPKAHVEAPVVGSMVLAGLMLKLGGLGLVLCSKFCLFPNVALMIIITISSVGGALISALLTRLTDMKVMIAYSSVVHMSLVSVSMISWTSIGVVGMVLMMIAHGFTSPGMFCGANMMYERSHSRSVILNKGLLSLQPSLALLWFFLIVLNFGGPFTLNLLSEILLINMLSITSKIMLSWVAGMCFFSLAYNLILYASLNQGVYLNMTMSPKFTIREMVILTSLITPAIIILLSIHQ